MKDIWKRLNEMNPTSIQMIRRGLFFAISFIVGALLYAVAQSNSPYFSFTFMELAEDYINIALSLFSIPLVGGLLLDYIIKRYQ